jgi:hypothetical protein
MIASSLNQLQNKIKLNTASSQPRRHSQFVGANFSHIGDIKLSKQLDFFAIKILTNLL